MRSKLYFHLICDIRKKRQIVPESPPPPSLSLYGKTIKIKVEEIKLWSGTFLSYKCIGIFDSKSVGRECRECLTVAGAETVTNESHV